MRPRLPSLRALALLLGLGGVAGGVTGCVAVGERTREAEPAEPRATTEAREPVLAAADRPLPGPNPLVPIIAPPPEPAPFAGRETVSVDELLAALAAEVPRVAESEAVATDYAAFLDRFELADEPELYLDYVRVKIAFEATRSGGWWGLRWAITHEQPNSELVWAAWHERESADPAPATVDELAPLPVTTATAECDELSALFAFVAQRIGLSRDSEVGLLWPTGNHVVAVWTVHAKSEDPARVPTRVVVPTSPIFLDEEQSLGTDGFNPWRQRTIYDYRRADARGDLTLPGGLASAFVEAVREHGHESQAQLQAARNARELAQESAASD